MLRPLLKSKSNYNITHPMRALIILFLVVVSFTKLHAQQISIEDIPLTWKDFIVKEGFRNHPYSAKIYTHVQPGNYKLKDSKIKFEVELLVDNDKSWVKEEFIKKSDKNVKEKLLSHEKGHLIIALIKFKQLENDLTKFPYSRNFKKEIDSIFKACYSQIQLINETYDNETNHMQIVEQQQEWIKKLLQQLNELYVEEKKLPMKFEIEANI
jgi:hypothetical protein